MGHSCRCVQLRLYASESSKFVVFAYTDRFTDMIFSFHKQRIVFTITIYVPTIFFTKLSLFLLYLRVFSPDRRTRYLIYFGIAFTTVFYSVILIYILVVFIPPSRSSWFEAWRISTTQSFKNVTYVQSAVNTISDFYLLGLPMPIVWKLQMPRRKKIGVSAIFLMGTLWVALPFPFFFSVCVNAKFKSVVRVFVVQSISTTG